MTRVFAKFALPVFGLLSVFLLAPNFALGQGSLPAKPEAQTSAPQAPAADASKDSDDTLTVFPHSETSRYWVSGQANIILQWHPSFPAKYSGPHSLRPIGESATSKVFTLYLGYELTPTTEVFLDPESSSGSGLSGGLGLAGNTNLDVVHISNETSLGPTPYLARVMLRQIIPLSSDRVDAERGPLGLATSLPARRIEI